MFRELLDDLFGLVLFSLAGCVLVAAPLAALAAVFLLARWVCAP